MDSAKNGKWIIPVKKFGMVRVKYYINVHEVDILLCLKEEKYKKIILLFKSSKCW